MLLISTNMDDVRKTFFETGDKFVKFYGMHFPFSIPKRTHKNFHIAIQLQ